MKLWSQQNIEKLMLSRLDGNVNCSRLWLKLWPPLKPAVLMVKSWKAFFEPEARHPWQGHPFQVLVEVMIKTQARKA